MEPAGRVLSGRQLRVGERSPKPPIDPHSDLVARQHQQSRIDEQVEPCLGHVVAAASLTEISSRAQLGDQVAAPGRQRAEREPRCDQFGQPSLERNQIETSAPAVRAGSAAAAGVAHRNPNAPTLHSPIRTRILGRLQSLLRSVVGATYARGNRGAAT